MSEKIYFCLLLLCGLFVEKIPGVFSQDVDKSNTLFRRKRVINTEPCGDMPLVSGDAPFVANIREFPGNYTISVGAILSSRTVITVATIVDYLPVTSIKILAGSPYSFRGSPHNVIEKKVYPHRQPSRESFALLIVEPPFFVGLHHTGQIALHQGPLLPGTPATVFGWGHNRKLPRGTNFRNRLRSITVPIMRHADCVNSYREHFLIADTEICTYDAHKRCGHTDIGAPLVVENELVGVYLRTGEYPNQINPDIYIVIQHLEYSQWIRSNIV